MNPSPPPGLYPMTFLIDMPAEMVSVPADLADELEREPAALRFFEGLSYSQQKWFATSVESARTEATRKRRVARAIAALRAGRTR